MSLLLSSLNPQQVQAVQHIQGPLLLLAGAGSGKTKTLTTRLAYLVDEVGVLPSSILCLTFTNKAGAEMRQRAFAMLQGKHDSYPLLCTFHKFGLIFLKHYMGFLKRSEQFVLIDSDDVKKILKDFKSPISPSALSSYISFYKNQALLPIDVINEAKTPQSRKIAELYADYQEYLETKNLLDFDDLLLLPYLILAENEDLAQSVSKEYEYIMVDEYQDTNVLQYRLLKLLTSAHSNLCVVGDDDQSIYSWRGADLRNILEFQKDFAGAKLIKLEQNYRSTPQILEFANALICKNTKRLGKTLQATRECGKEVEVLNFATHKEEIAFVTQKILELKAQGVPYGEIALLYRLNALSRNVEDGLSRAKIPYQIIGSIRFYERAEIKDALSYLRLMINGDDDFSLMRVINKPKRGLGKVTQEKLLQSARSHRLSVRQFCADATRAIECVGEKNYTKLKEFFELIEVLKQKFESGVEGFLETFQKEVDLLSEFANTQDEVDRKANLEELYALLREEFGTKGEYGLEDFLNDITLSSDLDDMQQECVSCMSVHSSKGLEFGYVFIVGFEDGIFPLSKDNEDELEEERRLGYVAFTRAKSELYITYVDWRFFQGKSASLPPSRFLQNTYGVARTETEGLEAQADKNAIAVGDRVVHKIFGVGRVLELVGKGKEARGRINFAGNERTILLSFVEKE
ncbi:hypothetical protein BBW65_06685 [Helicobacter enhydrae]|uniref:DNA 3'-5' helicase n=1 Tax=Helicobacter enhydrae TaxID=222136 RepID=A0A1B1U7R5_9HELI|nr:UvrD-helicase domain-containing protein [Helicobacter enhydrae]ANV98786.1 hypothetical protein BBW65_06685 [Helicobacter enhydrae]